MVWKPQAHPQYADYYEVLFRNDDGKAIAGVTRPEEGSSVHAIYMGVFLGEFPSVALAKQACEAYH